MLQSINQACVLAFVGTVGFMDQGSTDAEASQTGARFIRDAAASERPSHLGKSRDAGDAWVSGPAGKFWGRFGSAGLLVFDAGRGVLLQHRALWSHHGGTWGLPGGALHRGESAVEGALREAEEEAGVPTANVSVLFTSVYDVGYWSYTTVAVHVDVPFEPVISDPESLALAWVPPEEVASLELHPGFGAAWPQLRDRLGLKP